MKLIYLTNARIPTEKAHGYQIMKMCEEFSRAGIETKLWVPTRENPITDDAFEYYGAEKIFELRYVRSYDFLKFVKVLGRWSFYLQVLIFAIRVLFLKIPKDAVVLTRNPEIVFIMKLKGVKTVYECHDWFSSKIGFNLFLLKKVDKIVATNSFIAKNFQENGFTKEKILVAPNGVDLETFRLDISKEYVIEKLEIKRFLKARMKNSKVLLYTGSYMTMEVGKGIDDILESLKDLDSSYIFVAVGGSDKHIKHYQKIASEFGLEDRVFLLGRTTQKQLALFQRASDILLMPFPDKAHYRHHMTPLKMFEYLASGRPIIASDLPSIREIMNEENCTFCKPGDVNSLREAILLIENNKEEARKKSEKAKDDVFGCSWGRRAKKIINFFRK